MRQYNDYELVAVAQEGNEDAINIIYEKYKPIVIKKSKNAIIYADHHGIEINDIMQEGFIGLDEAIKNFSQDDTASFYTFASICIDRKIVNYLRKVTQSKNKILNEAITIDEVIERVASDSNNVEFNYISSVEHRDLIRKISKELTVFERKVFNLKIEGYSFEEIAKTLNKDVKSIYNTFHRIKTKIKKKNLFDD